VIDRRDADTYFDSLPYAKAEIKEPKPRELRSGSESKSYMSDQELRVRGLRVYRTDGQRKRVRTAKFAGFRKDPDGNIYVRYI
jgi:hypothetical protein